MKIKILKKDFIHIEALGQSIEDLDVNFIRENKAILIRDLRPFTHRDYVDLGQKFGSILPYDEGPVYSFSGEALDEVELHYDGVSASHPTKVPHWLIFHVQKASPAENGGAFNVADTEMALELISDKTYDFLKTAKLQFYNYMAEKASAPEISFEISAIKTFEGRDSLRIFLPSIVERERADSKKVFAGTTEKETEAIFTELREALYSPNIVQKFTFQDNDILILNNNFTFHGRQKFNKPVIRILNRIQALPGQNNKFGIYF